MRLGELTHRELPVTVTPLETGIHRHVLLASLVPHPAVAGVGPPVIWLDGPALEQRVCVGSHQVGAGQLDREAGAAQGTGDGRSQFGGGLGMEAGVGVRPRDGDRRGGKG